MKSRNDFIKTKNCITWVSISKNVNLMFNEHLSLPINFSYYRPSLTNKSAIRCTKSIKIMYVGKKIEKSSSVNLSFPTDREKTTIFLFFFFPNPQNQNWSAVKKSSALRKSVFTLGSSNQIIMGHYHICYTLVSK